MRYDFSKKHNFLRIWSPRAGFLQVWKMLLKLLFLGIKRWKSHILFSFWCSFQWFVQICSIKSILVFSLAIFSRACAWRHFSGATIKFNRFCVYTKVDRSIFENGASDYGRPNFEGTSLRKVDGFWIYKGRKVDFWFWSISREMCEFRGKRSTIDIKRATAIWNFEKFRFKNTCKIVIFRN